MGHVAELRRRFHRPPEATSWLDEPRRILRFLHLAVRKARADELGQQSAALAFMTLVSLVPLLTSLSPIGAWAFENQDVDVQERILEVLSFFFPLSEKTEFETLRTFLDNANKLSGFGMMAFIATALMAFSSIEQTINRIWNIPHQRPFRIRLWSFTLLVFWGPVLIGATYSGLFFLRRSEVFERFSSSLPALLLPSLVTWLGLTMLYWLVPYTKVHFASALGGGATATLLLEALRRGFNLYQEQVTLPWLIYGSLGLIFFFVISLQLTWWIVLLGSEVTYAVQHHTALTKERRRAAAPEGSWLALVALVVLADRLRDGEPITPHEHLADRLNLAPAELLGVLQPLLAGGLIRETGGDQEGFLLACDPHRLRLTEVLELYERDHWEVLELLDEDLVPGLEKLRAALADVRDKRAGKQVLADLLGGEAGA